MQIFQKKSINFAIDSRKLHLAVSNLLSKYRYFHTSDTDQQLSKPTIQL